MARTGRGGRGAWPGGDGDAGAGRAAGGSGGGGGFQRLRRSVSAGGAGPTPPRGMLSYPRGRAGDAQPPFCILHPVELPGGALLVLPSRRMLCIPPGAGPAGIRSPLLHPVGLDWGCSASPWQVGMRCLQGLCGRECCVWGSFVPLRCRLEGVCESGMC